MDIGRGEAKSQKRQKYNIMTIKQAIKTLIRTNKWRRGAEIEMPDPKELGEAIDVAIAIMEAMLIKETGLKKRHIKAERHE